MSQEESNSSLGGETSTCTSTKQSSDACAHGHGVVGQQIGAGRGFCKNATSRKRTCHTPFPCPLSLIPCCLSRCVSSRSLFLSRFSVFGQGHASSAQNRCASGGTWTRAVAEERASAYSSEQRAPCSSEIFGGLENSSSELSSMVCAAPSLFSYVYVVVFFFLFHLFLLAPRATGSFTPPAR